METKLIGCILNYANFGSVDLKSAKISRCVVREAFFDGTNLSKADCTESDFMKTDFSGANLTEADFRRAVNYSIRPNECILKKTKFSLPEATALLYGLDIDIGD